jgi:exopolysaccharide biosynthesis protein
MMAGIMLLFVTYTAVASGGAEVDQSNLDSMYLRVNTNVPTKAPLPTAAVPPTQTAIFEPEQIRTNDTVIRPSQKIFNNHAVYTEYQTENDTIYHVMRVDLAHAKFFVSHQQAKMAPSNFFNEYNKVQPKVDILINGDGWRTYIDEYGKVHMPTSGLAVSNGITYSEYGNNPQTIYFDKDNKISIWTPTDPIGNDIKNSAFNAISYQNLLVNRGQKFMSGGDPAIITPRTALGVTDDDHDGVYDQLILVVVDGMEFRSGMTLDQLTTMLIEQGAVIGVNMDGGTSSTMVVRDETTNQPIIYDNDPGSTNKSVANILGIKIIP